MGVMTGGDAPRVITILQSETVSLFLVESTVVPAERERMTEKMERLAAEANLAGGTIVEIQIHEEVERAIIVLDIANVRAACHVVENAGFDVQFGIRSPLRGGKSADVPS